MKSVLLFANPIAGRGRGEKIASRLLQGLAPKFQVIPFLQRPDTIADDALPDPKSVRAAIAIGGDGTLRAVTQRLYDRYSAAGAIPPILVMPLGTANLMGRHLDVDWHDRHMAQQVRAAIEARQVVNLDAAFANDRLFLLMAGIGIDAQIVHELDRVRSGPIDLTSYALPAALAMKSYSFSPLEVEIDGRRAFGPAPAMVFVGNVREYGTGFPVLPLARSDDGVLDVCILPCRSRADLIRLFLLTLTGDHLRADGVIYSTAKSVRITSSQEVPVQIDGEAAGHTPLNIEMLPARIPFIVTR